MSTGLAAAGRALPYLAEVVDSLHLKDNGNFKSSARDTGPVAAGDGVVEPGGGYGAGGLRSLWIW